MKKVVTTSQYLVLSVLIFLFISCSSESANVLDHFLAQPQISAPPELTECAEMVNNYVIAVRQWNEDDFNVSFDGINRNRNAPRFRISHIDDYKESNRGVVGGGTSFFVIVDCTSMKIIEELKMQ